MHHEGCQERGEKISRTNTTRCWAAYYAVTSITNHLKLDQIKAVMGICKQLQLQNEGTVAVKLQ